MAQPHGPHAGSAAAATMTRTYSCFGKGLGVTGDVDWLGGLVVEHSRGNFGKGPILAVLSLIFVPGVPPHMAL